MKAPRQSIYEGRTFAARRGAGSRYMSHKYQVRVYLSEEVATRWHIDRDVFQAFAKELLELCSAAPRPLRIVIETSVANYGGLFALFKGYVEFHSAFMLLSTMAWEWELRDPQLEDLM